MSALASPERVCNTLTFDDGPSIWTPQILDRLAEHGKHAMFFLVGHSMLNPGSAKIVRRIHEEGHTLGNHSWTHRRLTDLVDIDVRGELESTSELIALVTGSAPTLFRAPYFGRDDRVDAIAAELGMTHVGASCVPDDWATDDAEAVARVVLSELRPGAVVSLHDGIPPDGGSQRCTQSRQPTVEAVRLILEGMRG